MENDQIQPIEQEQKSRNHKGLKSVLIILAIALLLAGSAYGVYLWQQKNVDRLEAQVKTFQIEESKTAISMRGSSQSQPASTDKYLEVPEFGVKIKLSKDIEDAYYQNYSDKSVSLKAHSLDLDEGCRDAALSTSALTRVGKDEIDSMTGKKFSDNGAGVIIGDNYFYILGSQYACAKNEANLPLLSKVRQAFSAASKTIEKL